MINTILIVLFISGFSIFLTSMGMNVIKVLFKCVLRCLLGIVVIYIVNLSIQYMGGNIAVKINEIALTVSAFLGLPGIICLYGLQYYFLIR